MLFGFEIDMREKKRPIKNKIDNLQHHLLPKLSAITTYSLTKITCLLGLLYVYNIICNA